MGRPRKRPLYLFVAAEILGCIGDERVLDLEGEPADSLLDELQCPAGDDVLIALRKSFSLTFPRNPFIEGLKEAMLEIRRIGVEALKGIPDVLEGLKLKPIPAVMDDPAHRKVYLFKYVLARTADLRMKVKHEGKTRSLLNLIEHWPADELVRTLREVVTETFSEMHNEDEYERALRSIRQCIGSALPAFNMLLDEIEIELIATIDMSL